MHGRKVRLLQALVLGAGASLGWAAISSVLGLWQKASESYQFLLFLYMGLGTMLVFGVFGYLVGGSEERYATMSLVDGLTRLYNTRHFYTELEKAFARAMRSGQPLTLILMDLDHFKRVNDTYGHQAGDMVLVEVAARISDLVREGDTVARVGGEEFAVIMPDVGTDGGSVLAERLRQVIDGEPVPLGDSGHLHIRMSLGVASTESTEVRTPTELFAKVDSALYEAKETGRNRVVVKR